MSRLIAFASGLLFGIGLAMSEMLNRERIIGFLDVFGAWDPTLLFVMLGAVGTTLVAFQLVLRRRPAVRQMLRATDRPGIDRPLVIGSALFGIGWGISGYCPGPGVALLAIEPRTAVIFLVGVVAGSLLLWVFTAGSGKPAKPVSCG